MKVYRVVTRDHSPNDVQHYTVWFEGTRARCRAWILGRYGHWPPFAAITQRHDNFQHIVF